jgi:membrane-associated protease RseP (regulator of RpoE activity)
MITGSELTTIAMVLVAIGVLVWGFVRAKPFGKLGILAWLQSVVLMLPWVAFFGLFAAGIYLNLVAILFLLVGSTGLYIFLGSKLRSQGQDLILKEKAARMLNNLQQGNAGNNEDGDLPPITTIKIEIPTIPEEDLKIIKGIFGIDTFFATETIPYMEGVIFKGNLRHDPEEVHSKLSATLSAKLGDRYRLFLIENPEGKPTVVVLPSSSDPQSAGIPQLILAGVLLVVTVFTTMASSGILLGFDLTENFQRVKEVLPISAGLITILAAHEIGHIVLAKMNNVRLGVPLFIPSGQIASFGAITRFESILPSRKVLFDVALAGPAAGGIVSLIMLIIGLSLSHENSLFQVPTEFFRGSILVGSLAKVILGNAIHQTIVNIHPLAIVGWLGLVITALNLMPAGLLDGGRIVQAVYGRKIATRTTVGTLIILAIISLINPANSVVLYWLILILFLQRGQERPCLNDITEPNDARAGLALLSLFLMAATLIPLTPELAGRLGIG